MIQEAAQKHRLVTVLIVALYCLLVTPLWAEWEVEVVETLRGLGPRSASLAFDSEDRPCLSYVGYSEASSAHVLIYAYRDEDSWEKEVVRPENEVSEAGESLQKYITQTILRFDENGEPTIYVGCREPNPWIFIPSDTDRYYVRRVYRDGGDWFVEDLHEGDGEYSDYKDFSFALDDDNNPHILYSRVYEDDTETSRSTLRYFQPLPSPSGLGWRIQTIDEAAVQNRFFATIAASNPGHAHILHSLRDSMFTEEAQDLLTYVRADGISVLEETELEGPGISSPGGAHGYRGYPPRIALDALGTPASCYARVRGAERGNDELVYAYRTGPSTWQKEPVADLFSSYNSSLFYDDDDTPHIAYSEESEGGESEVTYAAWSGTSFEHEAVETTAEEIYDLSLSVDGGGEPHLIYHEVGTGLKYAHRAPPSGEDCWEISEINEKRITVNAGSSIWPSLVWNGTEYGVAWSDMSDGNAEIYFARIGRDGTKIGEDEQITDSLEESSFPSLVWTGTEYGVAWHDQRSGTEEIYFARIDREGNKIGDDLQITEAESGSPDELPSSMPSLAWNFSDNEYGLTWQTYRYVDNRIYHQIYFARIGADGRKRGDDVQITYDPEDSRFPSLVWTGTEYGVAWSKGEEGSREIYFARLRADGRLRGATVPISDGQDDSRMPSLVWNYHGNEYGVSWHNWVETDTIGIGNNEVHFGRIDPDGNRKGRVLQITEDDENSLYTSLVWTGTEYGVAWTERSGLDLDIFFVAIDADGNKIGDDLQITRDPKNSWGPSLVWTGAKYGVAFWDNRHSNNDRNDEIYFASFFNTCEERTPIFIFSRWEKLTGIRGGSVKSLKASQDDWRYVYAGTYRRGLYRSSDQGETWRQGPANINSRTVDILEDDPHDRSTLYFHVHDGEHSFLMKSEDGGNTISLSRYFTTPAVGDLRITALAMDRNNPDHLYVGFDYPVMVVSTDGGETWPDYGFWPGEFPNDCDGVSCLYVESSSRRSDYTYKVVGIRNPVSDSSSSDFPWPPPWMDFWDTAGIMYYYDNDDNEWDRHDQGLPDGSSADFLIAPRSYSYDDYHYKLLGNNGPDPDERGVYWLKWNTGTSRLGDTKWSFSSGPGSDLGTTERILTALAGNFYHLVSSISAEEKGPGLNNRVYHAALNEDHRGRYLENWALANNGIHQDVIVSALACRFFHPGGHARTILYCGTANNTLDDGLFMGPGGDGIYRSRDLGESWQEMNEGILNAGITVLEGDSERLHAGTVAGEIWESRDGGRSWLETTDFDNLDNLGVIKDIQTSADGEAVYALSERSLCVRMPNFFLPLWVVLGGDQGLPSTPGAIATDARDPETIFAGIEGAGVYRGTDYGFAWEQISADDRASAAIAVSPSGGVLYGVSALEGNKGKIYRGTSGGAPWSEVYDTGLTNYEEAHIAFVSDDNRGAESVYVSIGGNLYLSRDGGTSWQLVASFESTIVDIPLPFGGRFTLDFPVEITAVKTNSAWENLVFVSVGDLFNAPVREGGVYYGVTDISGEMIFRPLNGGLKTLDVTAFTICPGEGEDDFPVLYCGLLCGGIYRSTYGAWIPFPGLSSPPPAWWNPGNWAFDDEASGDEASESRPPEDDDKDDSGDKGEMGEGTNAGNSNSQWLFIEYSDEVDLTHTSELGESTGARNSNGRWFVAEYGNQVDPTTMVEIGGGTGAVNSTGQLFVTEHGNQVDPTTTVEIGGGTGAVNSTGQLFVTEHGNQVDLAGIDNREIRLDFIIETSSHVPVLDPIPAQEVNVGESVKLVVTASDPDGDELTYSLIETPEGATIDPSTGVFSWAPEKDQAGTHTVTVGVSDGLTSTTGEFTITVIKPEPAVVITSPEDGTIVAGVVPISVQLEHMERPYYALFYVNGGYKGYAWGIGRQEYTYKWNTAWERGKQFTITARVYDLATRRWYSAEPVTVERREPGVVIISPPGSSTVDGTVPITVKTEHMVRPYYAVFYVNGRYRGYAWGVGKKEYTYNWNTAKEPGTQATITARVYDLTSRQWYSAEPVTVRKAEVKPPAVTITPPSGGSPIKGTVPIALQFDNLGSDRAYQVSYYIDGKKAGWRRSPFNYTWDTKTIANGTHTLLARVILTPSNKTISSPAVSVTVDNQIEDKDPGAANIVSLQEGSTVTGTKTVSLDTSNLTDRIYEVRFYYEKDGKKNYIWWDRTAPYSVSWDTRKASGKLGNGDYHLLAEITLYKAGYPRVTSNAIKVTVDNK